MLECLNNIFLKMTIKVKQEIVCYEIISPTPLSRKSFFSSHFCTFSNVYLVLHGGGVQGGAEPPKRNLTNKYSNLVPEKGIKTVQHFNSNLKITIFSIFYEDIGKKKS